MSEMKIAEFAKIRRGASPRPISDPKYFGGNVGWVRIVDVTASTKFLKKTEQYVSALGESLSVRVDRGDLIMSICGTIGRPIIVDMPACIHDGFVHFYDIKNVDPEFLYYTLQFHEQGFQNKGQPGTQVNINTSIVGDFTVYIPSLPAQQKITKILSTIDGQIEKTEAIIAKYHAVKQGMLQDLFTRGIDVTTGELRPKYEDAPELYKESVLGMVPREWEVDTLGAKAIIQYGKSQKSVVSRDGKIPVYGTGGLMEYATEYLHDGESILIGRKGTIDKPFYVTGKFWTVDTAYYLASFAGNVRWLHYKLLDCGLKKLNEATGVPSINRELLYKIKMAFPEIGEQNEIIRRITPIHEKIANDEKCYKKLMCLKQGLMSDLLSGKVEVNL